MRWSLIGEMALSAEAYASTIQSKRWAGIATYINFELYWKSQDPKKTEREKVDDAFLSLKTSPERYRH